MFKKGQKVWCLIYGQGVVAEVDGENACGRYGIIVKFNDELSACYTADGKYHNQGVVTLFPHPVEVVKAITKPMIDWNHVNENFRYLVMDECGQHWLTTNRPTIPATPERWVCGGVAQSAGQFASLIPGTCNWKDSLVKRPN